MILEIVCVGEAGGGEQRDFSMAAFASGWPLHEKDIDIWLHTRLS